MRPWPFLLACFYSGGCAAADSSGETQLDREDDCIYLANEAGIRLVLTGRVMSHRDLDPLDFNFFFYCKVGMGLTWERDTEHSGLVQSCWPHKNEEC